MGRSVIGTVPGSGRLAFLCFGGAASDAGTGFVAAGWGETNVGAAGKELRPAGWLAAAPSRAAKSLES